jgi:hypothetical protein
MKPTVIAANQGREIEGMRSSMGAPPSALLATLQDLCAIERRAGEEGAVRNFRR